MSSKTRLISTVGILIFGLAFAGIYVFTHDFSSLSVSEKYRVIADGFTVPGILILGYGLLARMYEEGVMDGFLYGIHIAANSLIPGGKTRIKKYGDFIEEKKEKRSFEQIHFIWCGAGFLLVALLFIGLYFSKA